MYIEARARLRSFGDFSFFQAFKSQPRKQLKTFDSWAGVISDISFHLNSHHVDYHCWCMQGVAQPVSVSASASAGVATQALGRDSADSITLMVQWRNHTSGNLGVAFYTAVTALWSASLSDVHRCVFVLSCRPQISLRIQPAAFLLQRSQWRHHCRPGSSRVPRCFGALCIRLLHPFVFQVHPR
jgi:hypothetical protein